jgi:putative transposase
MAGEGLPVQLAARVLHTSESGYYRWRKHTASARSLRHAFLTEIIGAVHTASRGVYGARRVHAELTLGRGIAVSHCTVELLMARAGLKGLPGNKTRRPKPEAPTASDLVKRAFARQARDHLWVTDITEHPTREGKVYCAVVLDTYSRRVVGWSIDASQTSALVTNALSMAISNRAPNPKQGSGHAKPPRHTRNREPSEYSCPEIMPQRPHEGSPTAPATGSTGALRVPAGNAPSG